MVEPIVKLQELLGIELPIIQAPMAGVQGSALAAAVCNAGGLGSPHCAMLSPEKHNAKAAKTRNLTSSRPLKAASSAPR
jgi:nitronate monooxygenase